MDFRQEMLSPIWIITFSDLLLIFTHFVVQHDLVACCRFVMWRTSQYHLECFSRQFEVRGNFIKWFCFPQLNITTETAFFQNRISFFLKISIFFHNVSCVCSVAVSLYLYLATCWDRKSAKHLRASNAIYVGTWMSEFTQCHWTV